MVEPAKLREAKKTGVKVLFDAQKKAVSVHPSEISQPLKARAAYLSTEVSSVF